MGFPVGFQSCPGITDFPRLFYSSDEGHEKQEQDATGHDEATDFYTAVLLALKVTLSLQTSLFKNAISDIS